MSLSILYLKHGSVSSVIDSVVKSIAVHVSHFQLEEVVTLFARRTTNSTAGTSNEQDQGVGCTDDYYYPCDNSPDTYPTINDAGSILLIVTAVCCVLSVVLLPFLLRWGEQLDQYRTLRKNAKEQSKITAPISQTWLIFFLRKFVRGAESKEGSTSEDIEVVDGDGGQLTDLATNFKPHDDDDNSLSVADSSSSAISTLSSFLEDVISIAGTPKSQKRQVMIPAHRVMTLQQFLSREEQFDANDQEVARGALPPGSLFSGATTVKQRNNVYSSEAIEIVDGDGGQLTDLAINFKPHDDDDNSLSVAGSSSSAISTLSTFFEDVISIAGTPKSQRRQVTNPAHRVMTLPHFLSREEQFDANDQEVARGALSPGSLSSRATTVKQRNNVYSSEPPCDREDESQIESNGFEVVANTTPKDPCDSDSHSTNHHVDDNRDLRICCGASAFWRPWVARQAFNEVVKLFEVDRDLKRLVQLAVPFTTSAFLLGVSQNIYWVMISRFLGTAELAAATVVDIFQGITGAFLGGIIGGQISITSHALGVGNNYLAGQYVQQAQVLFSICFIPTYIFWWFLVYPLTIRIGMNENVASIAQSYIRVEMINNWMAWVLYSVYGMYEVTDHEVFTSASKIVTGYISLIFVVVALIYIPDASLVTVAYIKMALHFFSFIWAILYPFYKGWLQIFIPGWLCNFSLRNTNAVRQLLRAALPLAFGELVAYGEWEVLTILAAHNGPAQVGAWGLLGTLWETFESFTEGIGEASVIRVAFFLGKGDPRCAKVSGYRSAMLGTVVACMVTSIFWIFGEEIPRLFSSDPLVQQTMLDSIPLMGIGNLSMVTGMVCWSVIGAQGRYSLATACSFVCSWFVTMPLAVIFVLVLGYGVQGLVSAVAIGYSLLGMILFYIMLRSNWPKLSDAIQKQNAADSDSESDIKDAEFISNKIPRSNSSNAVSLSTPSDVPFDELIAGNIELQAYEDVSGHIELQASEDAV